MLNRSYTRKQYILMLGIAMALAAIAFYSGTLGNYNSTIYALSYKYGFRSRSLIGTIYQGLNDLLPFEMNTYHGAIIFTLIVTGLFFLFLLFFADFILQRIREEDRESVALIFLAFYLTIASNFSHEYNFGRIDLYMILISLIGVMLLIKGRFEWLILPLSIVGVCIHEGYVFMYLGVMLMLLLYRIILEPKSRRRLLPIFLLSAIIPCILLIYFELFSHGGGEGVWDEVVAVATSLSYEGDYHETLLMHELLGIDLSDLEWEYRLRNMVDLPVYTILMLPFLIPMVKTWKEILELAEDKARKAVYILTLLGAATMLPDYLLKCDFGRWTLAVMTYYIVITLSYLAMGDSLVQQAVFASMASIRSRYTFYPLFFAYYLLLNPLNDVYICFATANVDTVINFLLHLW